MATATSMAIQDGQASPATVTFSPVDKKSDGVYWFRDLTEPNPLLARMISVSLKSPSRSQAEPKYRATVRVYDPTPNITAPTTGTGIQPAPSKAYDLVAQIDVWIPQRSVLAERKDIRAFARNVLNHAQVITLIENLEMCT